MSRSAAASAPPLPIHFRLDSDLSLLQNARAAWDAKREVQRRQMEHNARVLGRKIFAGLNADEIEFKYYDDLYPETPTFVLDGELIAWNYQRKEFALIEICGSCGKRWSWNQFDSFAGLGRELMSRDARDPFLCQLCEVIERSGKK